MNKYPEDQVEALKKWLVGGKKSIFGIVYRDMLSCRQEPFGKDMDLFFSRAEKLRDKITKNPIIKKLHGEIE